MSKSILIFFFVFLGSISASIAQDTLISIPTGLASENKDYLQQNKAEASIPIISNKAMPKRLPVSLDQYISAVLDQGSQGSCTAFAVSEALSIRENYLSNQKRSTAPKNSQVLYSPTYLWVLGKQTQPAGEDCEKNGISYSTAFACIFNNELVYWDTYPYPLNDPNLCHSKCPPDVLNKKIQNRKFTFDDVTLDTSAFKGLLRQGYPICIATNLDMGYYDALYSTKGKWLKKKQETNEQHAMVIVDYDDDIRCFKVLDSHGTKLSDNGVLWLSYDLVNRDLNAGVVYGCYIVSFQQEPKEGPKNIQYTSSAVSSSQLKIEDAKLTKSTISGKVVDKDGNSLANTSITVKGFKSATVSDLEGRFTIAAPLNSTLVISSIGNTSQEMHFGYQNYKVYDNNTITTWTKQGYYRVFNAIRIGVIDLDKKNKKVVLSITDDNTGKLLACSIDLHIGESVEFSINDKKFIIKLTEIKHAGNVLDLVKWDAGFLNYSLQSATETLTQYF